MTRARMNRPCNAEAAKQEREKGGRNKETGIQENSQTPEGGASLYVVVTILLRRVP